MSVVIVSSSALLGSIAFLASALFFVFGFRAPSLIVAALLAITPLFPTPAAVIVGLAMAIMVRNAISFAHVTSYLSKDWEPWAPWMYVLCPLMSGLTVLAGSSPWLLRRFIWFSVLGAIKFE